MIKFFKALVATRRLIKDPENTPEVFKILSSLRGKSPEKLVDRLQQSETGRRIVAGELVLLDTLSKRETLKSLPEGSLGRTYFDFTEQQNISAGGLIDAYQASGEVIADERFKRVQARLRDSHDLWHVVTSYGRDPLGEACLLAFTQAQTHNPGILFLLFMAYRRLAEGYGKGVFKALRSARADGKRVRWLPEMEWESVLDKPLASVRQEIGINPSDSYRQILARHELAPAL